MSCMSFLMSPISTFISQTNSARWLGVIAVTTAIFSSACGGEGTGSPPVSPPTPPQPTGPGTPAISETGGIPAGFSLVWSDEFADAGLPDAGEVELRHRAQCGGLVQQRAAVLRQRAPRELERRQRPADDHRAARGPIYCGLPDWGGQRYSSARLITRDKASWTYGFFEVRAKLPCGVGTWPAIWMLSTPPQTRWPDDGELDIMEHVGFDAGVVHATAHTGAFNHTRGNHRTATTTIPDACNEFHRYQMHWSAESHHRRRRRSQLLSVLERQLGQRRVAVRQPAIPDPQYRHRRRLGRTDGRQRRHLPGAHGNRLRARLSTLIDSSRSLAPHCGGAE